MPIVNAGALFLSFDLILRHGFSGVGGAGGVWAGSKKAGWQVAGSQTRGTDSLHWRGSPRAGGPKLLVRRTLARYNAGKELGKSLELHTTLETTRVPRRQLHPTLVRTRPLLECCHQVGLRVFGWRIHEN